MFVMKFVISILVLSASLLAVPEGVTQEPRGTQLFPCVMTRYSAPIKLSGVVGVSFLRSVGNTSRYRAFFVQVEPGFGGGKLNMGYRLGEIRFLPIWNVGLSGSVLRTWGNPLGDVQPDQTYLGAELSGVFAFIGLNAGIYRHTAGDDPAHGWIYTLGAGFGI